jgi:predicted amidohydrolase
LKSFDRNNSFKVAIVQHAPVFLNIDESLEKAAVLAEEAANQGAAVIAFPETWLPGFPIWLDFAPKAALWDYAPAKTLYRLLVENSLDRSGDRFKALLDIAKKTDMYLVMGAHELVGGTLYNSTIYVDRGAQKYRIHRKLVPTYTERLVWGRGDGSTLSVLETEYGNIGGLICWEHWMPLARAAMHAQHETLHISQWPDVKDLHQLASRHYAFEGQCFVLAAGCVLRAKDVIEGCQSINALETDAFEILQAFEGKNDDLVLRGGSAIIAPDSSYIAGPVFDRCDIVYGDIEPKRIAEGHLAIDTSGHYSRPDVFQLAVNSQPQSGVSFTAQGKS